MKLKITPGILLLLTDILLLNIIYLFLSFNIGHTGFYEQHYTIYSLFNNTSWLLSFYLCGNYTYKPTKFKKLVKVSLAAYTLYLITNFIFFNPFFGYINSKFNLVNIVLFGSYMLCSRLLIQLGLTRLHKTGLIRQKIVIIGSEGSSLQLIKQLEKKDLIYAIEGIFNDTDIPIGNNKYPLIGKIDDCIDYAIKNKIQEIYTVIPLENDNRIQNIADLAELNFIRFKTITNQVICNTEDQIRCEELDLQILTLNPEPVAANIKGQILKRFFDLSFSLLVIVFVLSWLAPIIAILIKLDSAGPVFFKQLRTGIKNKPFLCYKFRSLHVNNDADNKQVTKNDVRYTRLGKFLRKSNLDELPQLFNVLAGDMSIVGSRPHMLKHTEIYSHLHNKYMRRHYIKPGLTGWAQVNGYRGEITVDEQLIKRVDHDLWYIENWNFWLDIRIVFQTFSSTVKGDKNAY